jgi:hypothetical protein
MASGDLIGGRSNAALTFQPAASVSIMITSASAFNGAYVLIVDSAGNSEAGYTSNTGTNTQLNTKIAITNSLWISFNGAGNSFTGIQIK